MNFAQYPALAARTEKLLPTVFARLEHAALGIFTETGEIGTPIKRIAIYGKSLNDFEKDGVTTLRQSIAEEIGDTFWYLAIIDNVFGFDLFAKADLTPGVNEPTVAALTSVTRNLATASGCIAEFVEAYNSGAKSVLLGMRAQSLLRELIYLAYLTGNDPVQIAADNIAKLQKRYPEKYTDLAAEARADKGGEDARNS
jgi:NTP pyrophosphatase (non-canonical NTP hydrolase)